MILKDIAVVPVVQEFYASLRDQASRSTKGHIWETRKQICIGKLIYQNMKRCANGKKVGVFFPHLVTALCRKVPNYTPDMFGLTHPEKKEEVHESEEEREDELEEGDDEMDFEDD
ncbi:hypothetical protein Gohar_015985 [Gossypium harknessii]|uniref:Uncharacterized protein n=1 Tax=Gossypium harknessii TaxID=34285 RepID=A0A7J9G1G6_9ROSI|nr:hypothetical protein [Gossypium harknessii]